MCSSYLQLRRRKTATEGTQRTPLTAGTIDSQNHHHHEYFDGLMNEQTNIGNTHVARKILEQENGNALASQCSQRS